MTDRDYVINIILKARDELAGTVAKAVAEVEALNKAAGRSGLGDMNKDAESLSDTLRTKFNKTLDDVKGKLRSTESQAAKFEEKFKSLGREAEETGKKLEKTNIEKVGRDLRRAEQDANRAAEGMKKLGRETKANSDEWKKYERNLASATDRVKQHSTVMSAAEKEAQRLGSSFQKLNTLTEQHGKAVDQLRGRYDKEITSIAKLKAARDDLAMSKGGKDFDFSHMDREINERERGVRMLAAEIEALNLVGIHINTDMDTGGFDQKAIKVEMEKVALGKDVHIDVDMDIGAALSKLKILEAQKNKAGRMPSGGKGMLGWLSDMGSEAQNSTHSIAAFDNAIRGFIVLGVVALSQQLLTIVTSLGAELIAVASSASLAGAALGGALVAGIAQALPMVGLLVAAFARVGAVMGAIKQHQKAGEKSATEEETGGGAVESAAEGVVNATEAVTAARENLREAELGLTKARFEARRELNDLIMAEKQAELAARGATLSQFEAQMALRQAISSGSIGDVTGAQIEVQSSRLSTQEARTSASRAKQDLGFQRSGSALRPDTGVEDAEKQIQQSTKALEQAERAAIAAKRAVAEAAAGTSAAAAKENFLLSELDGAEKRLYQSALRLYDVYKKVMRPITDTIIDSFTYATDKARGMFENKGLMDSFQGLADSMGSQFRKIVDEFTSPQWVRFFKLMTDEAGKNIGPLTDMFITLARTFRSIAEAASPLLRDLVGMMKEGAEEFEDWVGKGKPLEEFFEKGEEHLQAWLSLIGAVFELFGALITSSADSGKDSVEGLTSKIQEATEWIESHRKEVSEFFGEVNEVMGVVGEVLLALGGEILRVFNVESVETLGDLLTRVIVPALGEAIMIFGHLTNILDGLAKSPGGEFILKFGASMIILRAVLAPMIGIAKAAAIQLASVAGYIARFALGAEAVTAAGGPMAAVLGSISLPFLAIAAAATAAIAAFIYLSDKFGVLDDELEALQEIGENVLDPIIEPLEELGDVLLELSEAFGVTGDGAKGLGKIFEVVFVKYVKGIFIPVLKLFGSQFEFIAEIFGGMIKVLTGGLEILVGIFTLNFGKIEHGVGRLIDGITTPFRALFNRIKRIVSIGIEVVTELFGGLISGIIRIVGRLGGKVIHAIAGSFDDVWGWFKKLPGRLAHMAGLAVGAVVHVFSTLGSKILHAIGSIASDLVNAGKKLGKELAKGLHQAIKDTPILGKALELGEGAFGFAEEGLESINPFADGGPVGSGVGTKDDQLAVLTRGEHVLTTQDVANAGGHSAIMAWRRSLSGRAGQGRGGRYAQGGEVEASKQQANSEVAGTGLETLLAMIISFGGQAISAWDGIWDTIQKRMNVASNSIADNWRMIQKVGVAQVNKLEAVVKSSFNKMLAVASHDIQELQKVTYEGLTYVVKATNDALKGFGGKAVELSISKPKGGSKTDAVEGKAGGGFIGNQGERGADEGLFRLGRGEAVLNWAHQKVVDPAMRKMYGFGLNDMFNRTSGEHASSSPGGFAKGRAGGGESAGGGSHWSNLLAALNLVNSRHFPYDWGGGHDSSPTTLQPFDCSGAVSFAVQQAGYNVPTMTTPALAAWGFPKGKGDVTIYYNDTHTFMGVGDKFWGTSGSYRDNEGAGWFNGVPDAGYLSGFSTMHLPNISAPATWAPGGVVDSIKMPDIKGTAGVKKALAKLSLGKVVKGANKYLSDHMPSIGLGNPLQDIQFGGPLPADLAKYNHVYEEHNAGEGDWGGPTMPFNAIAKLAEWAGMPGITMAQMTKGESAQRPGATGIDPGGTKGLGLWMITTHYNDALIAKLGGQNAMLNPVINAKAAKSIYDSQGLGAWYGDSFVTDPNAHYRGALAKGGMIAKLLQGFATGGVVGGEGGSGGAIPILAHMGEWVLNQRQQTRMAAMLGTSVDKLKGMLGFSGGPTSFAGGGEPKAGDKKSPGIAIDRGIALSLSALPDLEHFNSALKYYLETVNDEFKNFAKGVGKKRKNLADFFSRSFTRMATNIESFKEGWEVLSSTMAITMAKATVMLGKGGKVIGRQLQPDQLLNLEIKQLYNELNYLMSQRGPILKSLRFAKQAFRKARKEGDTEAEQAAQTAIVKFKTMRRENQQAIAEGQVSMLEKREQRLGEDVNKINESAERRTGGLTTRASMASAMGRSDFANQLTNQQVPIWEEQKRQLDVQLGRAKRQHNQELARQIEDEIRGLEVSIVEAAAAMIQQAEEAIDTQASRERFNIELGNRRTDMLERFGNAAGRGQERGGLLGQEGTVISRQLAATQGLLATVLAQGFGPDVVIPLQEKIADLGLQLEENSAAIYSNTIAVRQAFIDTITENQSFKGGIFGQLESIVTGLGGLSGVVNQAKLTELIAGAGSQLGETGSGLRGQLGAFIGERLAGTPFGSALLSLTGQHGEDLVSAVQHLDFAGIENFLGTGSEGAKQFQALINAILENEVALIDNTKQLKESMQQNQIQSFTSTAWSWFRNAIFNGMGGLMPQYAEGTPYYAAAGGGEMTTDGLIEAHRGELIVPNNFSTMLRSMVRAGSMASALGTGVVPGDPFGIGLAGSMVGSTQASLASQQLGRGSASEIAMLREELARRTQEINVEVNEAEPSDPTYLANRLSFAVKNPSV